MIPFYGFKTVFTESVYIVSKTVYLIQLLVTKENRKTCFCECAEFFEFLNSIILMYC